MSTSSNVGVALVLACLVAGCSQKAETARFHDCDLIGTIGLSSSVEASIESSDCTEGDEEYVDYYEIKVSDPENIRIEMSSSAFSLSDVAVHEASSNRFIDLDLQSPTESSAVLDVSLDPGIYIITAQGLGRNAFGAYSLSLSKK